MAPENSCFYITHEISKEVLQEVRGEDRLEFIRRARRKAADLHGIFYQHIDKKILLEPIYSASYEASSLTMYESIMRQLQRNEERIPLREGDITSHERAAAVVFNGSQNERKQVIGRAKSSQAIVIPHRLEYFLNILQQRAPHLYKEIEENELTVENETTMSSIRGYYDGFMPFYLKFMKMREFGESTDTSIQKI